ncbi:hypothetical protein LUZ61_020952 [Rhynchospora tenuis]|uniref:GRF-type domain-containing protein n=1 Tax=Rhynchospora tenuis TaxID=198213 RepID=A0AAD6EPB3_9POAL|nr:hypothetical protein LUZ61_020952 [Rhynchospora tenuis]
MEGSNSKELVRCYCGEVAELTTAWKPSNPGRRFYGCRFYGISSACKFFRWYDERAPERSKEVINGLLRHLNDYEKEKHPKQQKGNCLIFILVILLVLLVIALFFAFTVSVACLDGRKLMLH